MYRPHTPERLSCFASSVDPLSHWLTQLVGCTVAPGFEFSDFELASRAGLLEEYAEAVGDQVDPEQQQLIESLTVG